MCTVPCYMEVYFCTLLTRRAQMESSGKLTPTLIWLPLPPVSSCITLLNLIRLVWFGLVWFGSVLYEVFPMSFLMEQAGGQSFTGKERVGFSRLYFL